MVVEVQVEGAAGSKMNLPLLASDGQIIGSLYNGTFMASALNQDGSVNSEDNPASLNSVVSVFVNGGGLLSPLPADGTLQGPGLIATVPITAGYVSGEFVDSPTAVIYAGSAPGQLAGIMQINVLIGPPARDYDFANGVYLTFGSGSPWPSTIAYLWVQ